MPLHLIPKQTWPNLAGWLVPGENCTALEFQAVERAYRDIGILEVPNGSNRGTRLDRYAARGGFPPPKDKKKEGPYWCALWVGAVLADCGLMVPENYAGTDYWLPYTQKTTNRHVAVVVYGLKKAGPVVNWGDAHHIGLQVRRPEPELGQYLTITIEGNRSFAGTASNNGLAVDLGPMTRKDVLGYIELDKLKAPT